MVYDKLGSLKVGGYRQQPWDEDPVKLRFEGSRSERSMERTRTSNGNPNTTQPCKVQGKGRDEPALVRIGPGRTRTGRVGCPIGVVIVDAIPLCKVQVCFVFRSLAAGGRGTGRSQRGEPGKTRPSPGRYSMENVEDEICTVVG